MDAQEIIRRFEQVKGDRGVWEQHWQEISDYVLPRRGGVCRDFRGPPGRAVERAGRRGEADRADPSMAPRPGRWSSWRPACTGC